MYNRGELNIVGTPQSIFVFCSFKRELIIANDIFNVKIMIIIISKHLSSGIWKWHDVGLTHALEDAASGKVSRYLEKWDEDADIDEAEEERDPQADKECFVMER